MFMDQQKLFHDSSLGYEYCTQLNIKAIVLRKPVSLKTLQSVSVVINSHIYVNNVCTFIMYVSVRSDFL